MVSFENGQFILRRRDDRLQTRTTRRSILQRRVILIVISLLFFYSIHLLFETAEESTYRSPLRSSNTAILYNDKKDQSTQGSNDMHPKEPSPKDDIPKQQSSSRKDDNIQEEDGDTNTDSKCKVSLNQKFIQYLQTLPPIPKKVHMFFPDKDYWRKEPPIKFVQHSILSLMKLNHDWNITVYDDNMIDDVIRKAAKSNIIMMEEAETLVGRKDSDGNFIQHPAHIVERSDIARLILMYMEGGLYVDVDRLINKQLDDVIQSNTRLCLPTHADVNFCQDLLCTSKKNEMFLSMIREGSNMRLQLERMKGWIQGGALFDLGPVLYNEQVFKHLFLENDAYSKCEDDVSSARELISNTNGIIVTKRETDCDDGLLVDDSLPECYERDELYSAFGLKAWAPEVNKIWGD